jgi:hypothetical protein
MRNLGCKKGRFYRNYEIIQGQIEKIYPSRAFFLLRSIFLPELNTNTILIRRYV